MEPKMETVKYKPIQKITDWPIYHITQRKTEITRQVIEDAIKHLKIEYDSPAAIRELVSKTLYLEQIRIKHERWKVDPKDDRSFWNKVKQDLFESDHSKVEKEVADAVGEKLLREIVTRYVIEITGNFSPRFYRFASFILPHFFNRMLNASSGDLKGIIRPKSKIRDKLLINGNIDKIRNLSQKGTIILLPTHFSNLDSAMLGFGMHLVGLPAFQYGAGLNLFNSKFFGFFMGNLGSYKLDRRKKNPIYLETLKSFSKINILNNSHTLFFPGGTRSRSGMLESHLKLGLLGTVTEAQRMHFEKANETGEKAHKLYIVPLSISYHFVLEAKSLIEDYLKSTGREQYITIDDEFSSLYKIMKFLWGTFGKSSEIALSLGEPIDIFGNKVDDNGNSIDLHGRTVDLKRYFMTKGEFKPDRQRDMEYTNILGDVLIKKYREINIVFSSHIVAFVGWELIFRKFPKSDLFTVLRTPEEDWVISYEKFETSMNRVMAQLREMSAQKQLVLADHISNDLEEIINHGIRNIGIYHSKEPLMYGEGNTVIKSENLKLLLFYHNRLKGYGLAKFI
jgi:glycerol-3-phosphate O-acyltransferase